MSLSRSEVDDDFARRAKVLVEQTGRLIGQLGVDVSEARVPPDGSGRFKSASYAYERLAIAQRFFAGPRVVIWEKELVDGRSGECLMQLLWTLRDELRKIGEG